jgi:lipopolysaccharide transport system ATP-binding protein
MGDVVISAEGVGKRYRIGQLQRTRYQTFSEQLGRLASAPLRRLRGATGAGGADESHIWALRDVSFQIRRGEAVALIGSNGAGKSTILKILSQITAPTTGRIALKGRVGSLLEVGTGFHPELTGRENVFLNGALLGMQRSEIARKFEQIVSFAEVEQFIDTPVKYYSSGMYVRLAFAVAAHLEPEILIVDEVLAVGDARFQRKCLGKMDDVARVGRTVIFVSHNMATIANLCRRAILLRQGELVAEGPTEAIITRYLDSIADAPAGSLAARTDRKGRGAARVTEIQYLDRAGAPTQYPICGEPLTVRVHYRSAASRPLQNAVVTLSVNKDERPYFLLSTDLTDPRQLDLEEQGWINFHLPELPLTEGSYYLIVWLIVNGEVQDFVDHAIELPVVGGDYFGTGKSSPSGWAGKIVLVRHSWEHGPAHPQNGQAIL